MAATSDVTGIADPYAQRHGIPIGQHRWHNLAAQRFQSGFGSPGLGEPNHCTGRRHAYGHRLLRLADCRDAGSFTANGSTTTESFHFDYLATGSNAGRLQYVTLRRQVGNGPWTNVRRAAYTYYDVSDTAGSLGDLQTATQQVLSGTTWVNGPVNYYRYYTGTQAHLLKFIVKPGDYARLAAAVPNPLTATDSQVAQYATNFFAFDSQSRVIQETVQGGTQTFTYTYTASGYTGAGLQSVAEQNHRNLSRRQPEYHLYQRARPIFAHRSDCRDGPMGRVLELR